MHQLWAKRHQNDTYRLWGDGATFPKQISVWQRWFVLGKVAQSIHEYNEANNTQQIIILEKKPPLAEQANYSVY